MVKAPTPFNYLLFATKNKYNLIDLRTQITCKNKTHHLCLPCLKDDELTLKSVFQRGVQMVKKFSQTNNIVFTDNHVYIEQIVGLKAFFSISN